MTSAEIATLLWQDGGLHEVRAYHDGRPIQIWIPCARPRAFARVLDLEDCQISVVPRTESKSWATGRASVVWAVLQSGQATAALERFRPAPTLVVRAGRTHRRWALWALSRPLWGTYIEQATERLSYALHGVRKAASAETLIPSPFSAPHYIEFETGEIYAPRQIVGHLKDAPPTDGWRRRQAA